MLVHLQTTFLYSANGKTSDYWFQMDPKTPVQLHRWQWVKICAENVSILADNTLYYPLETTNYTFIHFYTRFSSRDDRRTAAIKSRNTSRFSATSNNFDGSTPWRNQARSDMYSHHLLWSITVPLSSGCSPEDSPHQSFLVYSGDVADHCSVDISIRRRSGSTFKVLQISQLRTFLRSVTALNCTHY